MPQHGRATSRCLLWVQQTLHLGDRFLLGVGPKCPDVESWPEFGHDQAVGRPAAVFLRGYGLR
jgi:hypothetical protein